MTSVHKLLTPEEIATRAGSRMPFLYRTPRGEIFAGRAARLRSLAPGHAMQGYLELVALIAEHQQAQLDDMPPVGLPVPEAIALSHEHGIPPLAFSTHARDRYWCDMLRRMLRGIAQDATGPAAETAQRLENSPDALYEAQASKLLAGITFGLDISTAPFIGAGLQVYFSHLALGLRDEEIRPIESGGLCPCCAARPTASMVRVGEPASGYRYLHCALCSTEWHFVRIKCAACESTKGISYVGLDDGRVEKLKAPVLAETCDECQAYLKVCYMDRELAIDPCADDLATLALDILVGEAGREPWGVNFMLVHGDPEKGTS